MTSSLIVPEYSPICLAEGCGGKGLHVLPSRHVLLTKDSVMKYSRDSK
jgi:hypothetical protein